MASIYQKPVAEKTNQHEGYKSKVHIIKNTSNLHDIIMKMSCEARWLGQQGRPKMIKFILGDTHGCGSWRCIWPAAMLSTNCEDMKGEFNFAFDARDQSNYGAFDLIVFQRQVSPQFQPVFDAFKATVEQHQLPIVTAFEIDDWLFKIPKYNMAHDLYTNKFGEKYLNEIINKYDVMTVSTGYLKKLYSQYFPEDRIYVVPNLIPRALWDFGRENVRSKIEEFEFVNPNGKPTIFFAGGANRFAVKGDDLGLIDDLTQIEPLIRKTVDEWNWVFMGAAPLRIADLFDSGKIQHLPWHGNSTYPLALKRVKADIGLSPLIDNPFNRGKSAVKWMEYGAVGLPSIYTDLTPYDDLPAWMKVMPGDTAGWEAKIREFIASPELRMQAQEEQYKLLDQTWLEDNLDQYRGTFNKIIRDVLTKRGILASETDNAA